MKYIILSLSFFSILCTVSAEDSLSANSTEEIEVAIIANKTVIKDEIVINYAMIEKFNNAEFNENQVSFMDLVEHRTFNEVRTIVQAYKNGDIELLTEASIAECENNQLVDDNKLILLSEINLR